MVRNEETLEPTIYAERLPDDLANRQCFVLDPMLATGGSLLAAIDYLFDRGAVDVTAVCLIGAPEGLAAVEAATEGRDVTHRARRARREAQRASATSSRASATPATGCTAPSDGRPLPDLALPLSLAATRRRVPSGSCRADFVALLTHPWVKSGRGGRVCGRRG